jgi:glutamyl-tRNA synthetase
MSSARDGRYAPSPTGSLHLGNLRTALLAWLFARSAGARFVVRVEDLDAGRVREAYVGEQLADLRALGLDWDGEPVRQSTRRDRYEAAIARLDAQGLLYPCFCTRAEIRQAASAPHGSLPEGAYPGTCRALSDAERAQRRAAGRPFALRVRGESERIEFEDRIRGRCGAAVDDFVVRRADGVPAYQLAVVVDDADQGVGEVVRGDDLAESTPRQILLARLLELPVPGHAHVPLVLGAEGARLAKRSRPPALSDRAEPPAVTLALLAHSLGLARDRDQVQRPAELIAEFDPAQLPREPVVLG